ncbi:DUF177 domain-containing protein [Paracoccus sp. 1_MG-2023]|uniref:YceD family protein n=1 Tax=unclassified Paracoccus (in: a-proteobacteria) TaxID=2688777 RepID=UPI001C09BF57|nr:MULTISPECIES: DUF177 domain-containing protein [unclassified Paracoccus (in: a-proteobacteria)]MBU2956469.1 DUF177 domain-containing protein [Paracoccus sp. C2R09]MDO6669727.1 DUF177 domain-containing protein [Paracoccus sp. 1_MG-2023]
MTDPASHPQRLRVAHLNPNAANTFHLRPDGDVRASIADELSLDQLSRLDFRGEVRAEGREGWRLTGKLTARVTQPCVVTLKPVRTEIDSPVAISFSPDLHIPEGEEVEMPDEEVEPLGQFIDLSAVMVEALSLALPEYPRVPDAELDAPEAVVDATPADTRRPFADLDKLLGGKSQDS